MSVHAGGGGRPQGQDTLVRAWHHHHPTQRVGPPGGRTAQTWAPGSGSPTHPASLGYPHNATPWCKTVTWRRQIASTLHHGPQVQWPLLGKPTVSLLFRAGVPTKVSQ